MNLKRGIQLLCLALPLFVLDYLSKALVHFYFQPSTYASPIFPFDGITLFQNLGGIDFCIHHVTNKGAAWGLFGGFPELLLIFRVGVIISLLCYMIFSKKGQRHQFPLTLILTGAVGNVLDYFIYGHVVDMFHFVFWGYSYPVFNIADSAISCGMIWLLIQSYTQKKKEALSPVSSV